jgi:aconitate hydratase
MTSATQTSRFDSAKRTLRLGDGSSAAIYSLAATADLGLGDATRLPRSIKVLLEAALRHCDGLAVTEDSVRALAAWDPTSPDRPEIAFKPARVVLQDFTGVPCVVDLAALRDAVRRAGKDPAAIEPSIPVDLVIDHSVQVDRFGSPDALAYNMRIEFERNRERYEFLRWGQSAFRTLRIVPPGVGIVHQVNLEYLATCVALAEIDGAPVAFPDSLVGADSHTTMIDGLGIVGWGVGGIEAEAVMLGQPVYILSPEVVGFRLDGELTEGVTATDLTLTVTQMLRAKGVVGKFVEFYGPGLSRISVADRATIANMSPEYGATMGFFPIDAGTLDYLRETGRDQALIDRVERYAKEQGLFRRDDSPDPIFSETMKLDLSTIEPSLAGPKRPQDRVALGAMKQSFKASLTAPTAQRGYALDPARLDARADVRDNGRSAELRHGSVVIAAITSCTNTSNPSVMLGAGLIAKKAVERGLRVPSHVKTSLAPGSRVVTDYYKRSGLDKSLAALGFDVVGYGCTTCIGNSGPLPEPVSRAIEEGKLVAAAVLSGNRNFEGRVNPQTQANYLASPPLVVAFALAGRVDIDLTREPIGKDKQGRDVYLKDIWPTNKEIAEALARSRDPEAYAKLYGDVRGSNPEWDAIEVEDSPVYPWSAESTYIQEPPYFQDFQAERAPPGDIVGARCLAIFGDSVTTDHISPAGSIAPGGPAGKYLVSRGVAPKDFNSYGSRRGNHQVMMRGTFANIRIKNRMVPGVEGGVTAVQPGGDVMPIYDAAMKYMDSGTPLIVMAGAEYGAGSSRDWAAKGTKLLGVRAVIATGYERIHRSNLVMMGVLPLQFEEGQSAEVLGLTGAEKYAIRGIAAGLTPKMKLSVDVESSDGNKFTFSAIARIDSPIEIEYYRHGGILDFVLRDLLDRA